MRGRGAAEAPAAARPAEAAPWRQGAAGVRRSDRPRRTGQCRRPGAARARWLYQRRAGLSLLRRRALSGLCGAGQVTDVALQQGEQLVGSGPVAAGDTVRWIIGDTESGAGATKRVHIMVKPTRPDLVTNLVINTDRRTYLLELRSRQKTYMASVSWLYPQDQLIALRRQNAVAAAAAPIDAGVDVSSSGSATQIRATIRRGGRSRPSTTAPRSISRFPRGIAQGEMPPLFVIGPEGEAQLVNYRVRQKYYIVDRLFAAAELRLGGENSRRCASAGPTGGRDERRTPENRAPARAPSTSQPAASLRLRAERPRVTRLSRKVLAGGAASALLPLRRGVLGAAEQSHARPRRKNFTAPIIGRPRTAWRGCRGTMPAFPARAPARAPLPGDLGRPILNAGAAPNTVIP